MSTEHRITLESGFEFKLMFLQVRPTYDGMLEGYPSPAVNDQIVAFEMARAEERFSTTFLVPPAARPRPTSGLDQTLGGPWRELPHVACSGLVGYGQAFTQYECGLVWFQDSDIEPMDIGNRRALNYLYRDGALT